MCGNRDGDGDRPGRARPAVVTMWDVARAAGVGIATVSRSFGNPGRVNAVTREHVLAAAAKIGYRPKERTATEHPATIGLLVPDITNPHFFGAIRGAERRAAAAGFTMVLGDSQHEPRTEESLLDRLAPMVDGVVLASTQLGTSRIRELAGSVPLVLLNREVNEVSSVIVDHTDGTRQIVEHLVSFGHRSIAFLGGPRQSWSGARRWQALQFAARERGVETTRIGPFVPSLAGGAEAADVAVTSPATALVAHNDLLALGMLQRLGQRGVRVPEDVSVVGHDDIFGTDFSAPPLTTLAGAIEEAGRAAVDTLLTMIASAGLDRPTRLVLPSHLVVRSSTGPCRGQLGSTRRTVGGRLR